LAAREPAPAAPVRQRGGRRVREILTPEGVPLTFLLADVGQRVTAFVIDLLFMVCLTGALVIPAAVLAFAHPSFAGVALGIGLVASFLVWNFYFVWFELHWQGTTPGKRRVGIRAIDGAGGPASADALVARNLMRDVEVFLPLVALFGLGLARGSGWLALGSMGWLFVFALLPFFNRDRLRVGDLVAGTLVVCNPTVGLLRDLAGEEEKSELQRFAFTSAQLDVYGIYELQVLEEVLRGQHQLGHDEAVAAVAAKVVAKIAWGSPPREAEPFLRAFYGALRARLEQKLLLGRRKENKYQ
jgi:uncharacterized RDD family membrane protein YckC